MSDGRYLLVVSITQGRNFPAKNGKRLVVDGKFNDELLSSDPVQHSPAPQINTGYNCYIFNRCILHARMREKDCTKINVTYHM